jgi:anti-sigma factor RsiW
MSEPEHLSCERFFAFMQAYKDGELADEVRTAFRAHIEACPPCVDYLDGYERSVSLAKQCCCATGDGAGAAGSGDPDALPEGLVAAILAATSGSDDVSSDA